MRWSGIGAEGAWEECVKREFALGHTTHLTVHVADDLDRWRELDEGWLGQEDLSGCHADCMDLGVFQWRGLCDFARVTGLEESPDHVVDV